MLPDPRLLAFTVGVRGRIALAVAAGLAAALVGIGRLAALGWLLRGSSRGEPFETLAGKFALVGAIMVLRGWLEYWRNMIAHRTAARVQMHLRERLYDKVAELGPAWFGLERTGKVLVSIVEGGRAARDVVRPVPAPALRGRAHPDRGIRIPRVSRPSGRAGPPRVRPLHPRRPRRVHPVGPREQPAAPGGLRGGSRPNSSTPSRGSPPLKAFGQSGARGRRLADRAEEVFRTTMWVLAVNSLGRGITDVGLAVGAAVVLGYGAFRVEAGRDDPRRASHRADDGDRGVPAAARPPRPAPPGTGSARRRRRVY